MRYLEIILQGSECRHVTLFYHVTKCICASWITECKIFALYKMHVLHFLCNMKLSLLTVSRYPQNTWLQDKANKCHLSLK